MNRLIPEARDNNINDNCGRPCMKCTITLVKFIKKKNSYLK